MPVHQRQFITREAKKHARAKSLFVQFLHTWVFRTEVATILVAVLAFIAFGLATTTQPAAWTFTPVVTQVDQYMSYKTSINQTEKEIDKASIKKGTTEANIAYCNNQLLDIYHPRNKVYPDSPMVMYIHGGGFILNSKTSEPDQLANIDVLRDEGFAVVSIDYRKVPSHYYPAPIEDTLCALRFLRANAEEYELDKEKFAVYGFSAGGYLASMAAMLDDDNPFKNDKFPEESSRVQAIVTLAGLFDFQHGMSAGNIARVKRFLNGVSLPTGESVQYLTTDDPPFLLIHGAKDQFVPVAQDDFFIERLKANKVPYEVIRVMNADHGLNPVKGELSPSKQAVRDTIRSFLKARLLQ